MASSLPPAKRPFVVRTYHTDELPATPQRDYRIPAHGWLEAPEELLRLGDELNEPVEYKRRIGKFLLWRAGPPVGDAWYLAISVEKPTERYRFRLRGREGEGLGPDSVMHRRFRTWKESLLAAKEGDG